MPLENITNDPLVPDLESTEYEERLDLAIKAINASGLQSNGRPYLSFRQAAKDYDVKRSTLSDRFRGVKNRKDAHADERKLSPAHEKAVVDWAKEMGRRGLPLQIPTLAAYAKAISGQDISDSWVRRFRTRHPELRMRWTTGLEKCRAKGLNPTAVKEYFNVLTELINKYNIPVENIYNTDEKGIQLGVGKKVLAFFDRDQKDVYNVEDGDRELVTIIETVCANGESIVPAVIFKGQRRDLEWGRNNPCNAR
jgi:hypothetical protein